MSNSKEQTRVANENQERKYHAPAVEKALDILEFMAEHPRAVSLKQLSEALQKTPSELFRIVDCLARRGYLLKNPQQNLLSLSFKVFELANGHPQFKILFEVAERPFVKFCEETGADCHLSALEGYHLFVLHGYESPTPYSIRIKTGSRFPAWQVNSGRFLLARLPHSKRKQLLSYDPSFLALDSARQEDIRNSIASLSDKTFLVTKSLNVPVIDDIIVPLEAPSLGTDIMVAVPIFRTNYTSEEKEVLLSKIFETTTEVSTALQKGTGG